MTKRILLLQGHPDRSQPHLLHALAASYADAARAAGHDVRLVVTMGMPAVVYRWYFRAHSVKSLERNILGFVGIAPVNETLIGAVGNMKPEEVATWQRKLARLGTLGE
jgi:putative NADPH-quinone reductase